MTTPEQARKLADEVQQAVMNIPADHAVGGSLKHLTVDYRNGYVNGHRDARHAAAEAVLPLAQACRDMAAEVERLTRNLNMMTELRAAANEEVAKLTEAGGVLLREVERLRGVVRAERGEWRPSGIACQSPWCGEDYDDYKATCEERKVKALEKQREYDAATERLIHGDNAGEK